MSTSKLVARLRAEADDIKARADKLAFGSGDRQQSQEKLCLLNQYCAMMLAASYAEEESAPTHYCTYSPPNIGDKVKTILTVVGWEDVVGEIVPNDDESFTTEPDWWLVKWSNGEETYERTGSLYPVPASNWTPPTEGLDASNPYVNSFAGEG